MLPTKLPCFAAPMPRRRLVRRRIAIHARTEVLPPLRIVALNLHIRIAEANLNDVAAVVLNVDSTLLPLARSVERLVQRHLLALVGVTFLLGEGGFHSPDMTFLTVRFRMIMGMSLSSIRVSAFVS